MGTYNFSEIGSFKVEINNIDEKNAKEALRILVDFLKNESE